MTWLDFKTLVNSLLTTDGNRLGTEAFMELQMRAALVDIQNFIPFYRAGHEEVYGVLDLGVKGLASSGILPETADIQDCYLERFVQTLSTPITVTASGTTATASSAFFTAPMQDREILFASGERVRITAFTSDTVVEFSPAFESGAEPAVAAFSILSCYSAPFIDHDWEDRYSLTHGQTNLADQYPRIAIDPRGEFIAFPQVVGNDQIRLYWDGVKTAFGDDDVVPFDDQCSMVVAEFVKGECARNFDKNVQLWASYNAPSGSYNKAKRALWREKRRKIRLKS